MSDEIKAALVAAVDASFRHDGDGVPPPLHVRRERHWRVTHEIAAFLRALPDPASPEGFEAYRSLGRGECFRLWLADAVERAAREAGDG